jgi:hypothetical protein
MSDTTITDAEIQALLQELDGGPSESVAAGPEGLRPLGPQQRPGDDEIVLPRGVWGEKFEAGDA